MRRKNYKGEVRKSRSVRRPHAMCKLTRDSEEVHMKQNIPTSEKVSDWELPNLFSIAHRTVFVPLPRDRVSSFDSSFSIASNSALGLAIPFAKSITLKM